MKSQKCSFYQGPNFIYLGGQKYGYRPVPAIVDSAELKLVRETLVAMMERNTLMEFVYPRVKEYCRERYGIEFQVPILWMD